VLADIYQLDKLEDFHWKNKSTGLCKYSYVLVKYYKDLDQCHCASIRTRITPACQGSGQVVPVDDLTATK